VVAGAANAYVRARTTDTFVPLFWTDPRNALEVARPPQDVGVTEVELRAAAQKAVAAWSYPQLSCTGVALRLGGESTDSQVAARDGRNRIIMRTTAWCRDPVALTHCFDPAAVALTSVFSASRPGTPTDGEILEADIEVNAVGDYQWGTIPDGPISGRDYANIYDLPSVLTHEVGHFIGLDHTCLVPNTPLLLDDQDMAVPSCGSIPSAESALIEDATMYPFMNTTDVKLRTLTADDARAACEIYPVGSPPIYEWTGAGGCSLSWSATSDDPSPLTTSIFSAVVITLFWRRSRRRAHCQSPRNAATAP
jgi:hypothetical protein